MDLYSIRNQRISPNEEFPLLCFRSARAWHSLLAERHTGKKRIGIDDLTKAPFLSKGKGVTLLRSEITLKFIEIIYSLYS